MHGYDAKNLGQAFRTVRKNTIQIAEEIPEDKYDFRPTEGTRSVAETLRHIAVTTAWPIRAHGQRLTELKFEMFQEVMANIAAGGSQAQGQERYFESPARQWRGIRRLYGRACPDDVLRKP